MESGQRTVFLQVGCLGVRAHVRGHVRNLITAQPLVACMLGRKKNLAASSLALVEILIRSIIRELTAKNQMGHVVFWVVRP